MSVSDREGRKTYVFAISSNRSANENYLERGGFSSSPRFYFWHESSNRISPMLPLIRLVCFALILAMPLSAAETARQTIVRAIFADGQKQRDCNDDLRQGE